MLDPELKLRTVYAANLLVAGTVGVAALFFPHQGGVRVFSETAPASHAVTVTGALWCAIALTSALGLAHPRTFSVVLLIQLVYKGAWLIVVCLPWLLSDRSSPFPTAMAAFFALWVILLPFAIPWSHLFRN